MTREEAIEILEEVKTIDDSIYQFNQKYMDALEMAIKALEQEQLTDKEQRIFLSAMGREAKVCKDLDEEYPYREPYEDTLVSVCKSIKRKVKKALWK